MKTLNSFESAAAVHTLLESFTTIDLQGLNERAPLLERRDSKYVLNTAQICRFLHATQDYFDVLEISGRRQFQYRTVYFDTAELDCYHDHNKDRRKRIKVRYRHYVDHDLHFFEVKLKGRRNTTHKYRQPISRPDDNAEQLPASLQEFGNHIVTAHYGQGCLSELARAVTVHYDRITLISRVGGERITIDSSLSFSDGAQRASLPDSKWLIEIKSRSGVSSVDRWLFRNGHRPVPRCSKYCIGVSMLKLPGKNNRFTPVLRRQFRTWPATYSPVHGAQAASGVRAASGVLTGSG